MVTRPKSNKSYNDKMLFMLTQPDQSVLQTISETKGPVTKVIFGAPS